MTHPRSAFGALARQGRFRGARLKANALGA